MNKKNLIIVSDKNNAKLLAGALKKKQVIDNSEFLIIATTIEAARQLDNRKISYKAITEFYPNEAPFLKAVKFYEYLAGIKTRFMPAFKEVTKFDKFIMWDVGAFRFVFGRLNKLLKKIDLVKSMLEIESPGKIILTRKNNDYFEVIKQLSKALNIDVSISDNDKKYYEKTIYYVRQIAKHPFHILRWLYKYLSAKLFNLKCDYIRHKKGIKGRSVLFFSFTGRFFQTAIPVIEELNKDKRNNVLVIDSGMGDSKKELFNKRVLHKRIAGYVSIGCGIKVRQCKRQFKRKLISLEHDSMFKDALNYEGLNLWPLLKSDLCETFLNDYPNMVKFIELVKLVLLKESPQVVVMINDKREISDVCNLMNIPVVSLQSGSNREFLFGGLTIDRILVNSEFDKDYLVDLENSPQNIVITGQPKFDFISTFHSDNKKKAVFKFLRLDENKRIIMVAGTDDYREFLLRYKKEMLSSVFKALSEICCLYDNLQVVVKMHPYEFDRNSYEGMAKDCNIPGLIILKDEIDTLDLLYAADLLISRNSTLVYEAVVLNKKVVYADQIEAIYPFLKEQVVLKACAKEEIKDMITKCLFDKRVSEDLHKNRERFIKRYAHILDGKASSRAVDSILSLIN